MFVAWTPEELISMAIEAVELSMDKRPGPVVVVMPRDFGDAEINFSTGGEKQNSQTGCDTEISQQCDDFIKALKNSKFPLIIAGELARQKKVGALY